MKPVHILILFVAFLSACQSDKSNTGLPITKDSLMGDWVVIRSTASSNEKFEAITQKNISSLKDQTEMSIFHFQQAGVVTIDQGKIEKKTGSWLFNAEQRLIIQNNDRTTDQTKGITPVFTVTRYKNDSLTVENIIKNDKDSLHIRHIFKRLRNTDSVPDLFQPELNKWREKPLKAEDDVAIRARLKQVLYYYSAYFASFSYNDVPYFNTEKIFCPVLFYSGGIGLKKFNIKDEWTNIFWDGLDAQKAHAMLSNAFSNIHNYPDKGGDYVQEYVVALKMVADAL